MNNFDVMSTSFMVALEAGKIEYWKDLKQTCENKIFTDSDSVVCIKFLSENPIKFCALTNNGNAKIGLVESDESLYCYKELDLHDTCKLYIECYTSKHIYDLKLRIAFVLSNLKILK